MYCNMCGTQAVPGAKFCAGCGAACAQQQPPPQQQYPAQNYPQQPYQQPYYQQQPESGQKRFPNLSDLWAWMVALSPAIISLVWLLVLLVMPVSGATWWILVAIGWVIGGGAILLDTMELKRHGISTQGIWWTWKPYPFERAARTNRTYGYAIAWIAAVVVSFSFDIWLFVHFGVI